MDPELLEDLIQTEQTRQEWKAKAGERLKEISRKSLIPPDDEITVYITPGITERGFILTEENIQELKREDLEKKAREFIADFFLPNPGISDMGKDDLRSWLLEICSRPKVREAWQTGQDEREFKRQMTAVIYEHPKNGKKLLDHSRVGDYLREKFRTVSFKDQIYIYDAEQGIYRRNSGELEEEFRKIVEFHDIKCKVRAECGDVLFFVKNSNQIKDEFPFNKEKNLINVQNGVIKIDPVSGTASLIPYSSEHMFTYKIPRNYKPDIDTGPMMEVLRSWVPESDIPFIIQPIAQALVQMMVGGQLKKATLLQGQKNGGKSTCVSFIEAFLGDKLSERSTLTELCTGKYIGGKLEGKLLCSAEELKDTKLTNSDTFKGLVGDGKHRIERKFERDYSGFLYCSYLFACNLPPKIDDDTKNDGAWWERWNFVIFPYYYDSSLKFKNEIFTDSYFEQYLKLVVDMVLEIIKNDYSLIAVMDEDIVRQRWTIKMNIAGMYIEECWVRSDKPQNYNPDAIFEHCKDWCIKQKIDARKIPKSRNQLTRDIGEWLESTSTTIPDPDKTGRKKSVRVYRGMYRLKTDEPDKYAPVNSDDDISKYLDM